MLGLTDINITNEAISPARNALFVSSLQNAALMVYQGLFYPAFLVGAIFTVLAWIFLMAQWLIGKYKVIEVKPIRDAYNGIKAKYHESLSS